jgi:glycosyltransferase involved in cell wall biosynthesis
MWRTDKDMPLHNFQSVEADICLIAEGCYPFVAGGVSTWIDWLIRSHPELTFSVLAILPKAPDTAPRYAAPPNLKALYQLHLDATNFGGHKHWPQIEPTDMSALIGRLLRQGSSEDFSSLIGLLGSPGNRPSIDTLLNSEEAWETLCGLYGTMPQAAFLGYFWAWRTLVGGLFKVLTYPLPKARLYHAVSTGYAGLLSSRATIETGRKSIITEHGIYSNERRIEILMADWIANSIETGLDLSDNRTDIREFWAGAFENFARIAYSISTDVVALYQANHVFQRALGAKSKKLHVIPNGVDFETFGKIERTPHERPTIAFIGRVTPIKDVQTFIDVAELLHHDFPDLEALIIGPMDEDPDYARDCINEAVSRHLDDVITFTGPVDVKDYLGRIDVLVLTSISEALPLVILEAGAAGIPCITTDVGACNEILTGSTGDDLQSPGGMVVPVGASGEMAFAIASLLADEPLRQAYGEALRQRVKTHYRAEVIAGAYTALYERTMAPQPQMEV